MKGFTLRLELVMNRKQLVGSIFLVALLLVASFPARADEKLRGQGAFRLGADQAFQRRSGESLQTTQAEHAEFAFSVGEERRAYPLEEKTNLRAPHYQAKVSFRLEDGTVLSEDVTAPDMRFFEAVVGPEEFVSVTLFPDGKLQGLARVPGKFFAIENVAEPLASAESQSVTITEVNREEVEQLELGCGIERARESQQTAPLEPFAPSEDAGALSQLGLHGNLGGGDGGLTGSAAIEAPHRLLEMGTEFDESYLRRFNGDVNAANAAALAVFNTVDTWYRAELGVRISVVYQHGWTSNSPYLRPRATSCSSTDTTSANCCSPTSSECMLTRMSEYWPTNQYAANPTDLVHLLTSNISEGGVVGRAFQPGACGVDFGTGYGVTMYQGSTSTTSLIVAHEVGHNLGASHDTCTSTTAIMCPSVTSSTSFSPISRTAIFNTILAPNRACLSNEGQGSAPLISQQPASRIAAVGTAATLQVVATSPTALGYQWYKDGFPITGANTASLSIASMQVQNVGAYSVRVMNAFGATTSQSAALAVSANGIPATIASDPVSQTLEEGQTLALEVVPQGTAPFTFQWRKNGYVIPGALSASFQIGGVSLGDAGRYSVIVSNSFGASQSGEAVLTVLRGTSSSSSSSSSAFSSSQSSSSSSSSVAPLPMVATALMRPGDSVSDGGTARAVNQVFYNHSLLEDGRAILDIGLAGVPVSPIHSSLSPRNGFVVSGDGGTAQVLVKTGMRPVGVSTGALSEHEIFDSTDGGGMCLMGTLRQDGQLAPVKTMWWSLQGNNFTPVHDSTEQVVTGRDVVGSYGNRIAKNFPDCRAAGAVGLSGTQCGAQEAFGAFITDATGNFRLVAQAAHPATGTSHVFSQAMEVSSDINGNVAIWSGLNTPTTLAPAGSGIWSYTVASDTAPRLLVRTGQTVAEVAGSIVIDDLITNMGSPKRTSYGKIVFPAKVRTASGAQESRIMLATAPTAALAAPVPQSIVKPGSLVETRRGTLAIAALHTPRSWVPTAFDTPEERPWYLVRTASKTPAYWVSDDAEPRVLFFAALGTGTDANQLALVESAPDPLRSGQRKLRALLTVGDLLPDSNLSLSAYRFGYSVGANRFGDLVMWVKVTGQGVTEANDGALVQVRNGIVRVIAREGAVLGRTSGHRLGDSCHQQDPNAAPGSLSYEIGLKDHAITMNDRGQAVITPLIRTTEAPVTSFNACTSHGVLAINEAGQLFPMAVSHEPLTLSDSQRITVGYPAPAKVKPMNNSGELLFTARIAREGGFPGIPDFSGNSLAVFKTRIPACGGDYDRSGSTTIADLDRFLAEWLARSADFNNDGTTSLQDLFSFLQAWFEGC